MWPVISPDDIAFHLIKINMTLQDKNQRSGQCLLAIESDDGLFIIRQFMKCKLNLFKHQNIDLYL